MIDKNKAHRIAREFAEQEGWVLDDPEAARQMGWTVIDPSFVETAIRGGEPVFIVKTNINWIDGSTHIVINSQTGNILSVHSPSP